MTATQIELKKISHAGDGSFVNEDDGLLNNTSESQETRNDALANGLSKITVTSSNIKNSKKEKTDNTSDLFNNSNDNNGQTTNMNTNISANNTDTIHKSHYLKSTLKRSNQAWVDPWEAAVQETFYHKELKQLRPTYNTINANIAHIETMFDNNNDNSHNEHEIPDDNQDDIELEQNDEQLKKKQSQKFGAWDGVCAGCLLNIFGVIMFLRVGWMVGQSGILGGIGIILISSVVTTLTTLSMSAICTNGTIKGGGAYYLISRSLGPSAGGAIGILFGIGMMVAVSLYLIGLAETLVENLRNYADFGIFEDPVNDVRIYSNLALIICLILALVGLKYVIKAQLGLLFVIIVSIISLIIGSFFKSKDNINVIGVSGWSNGNFNDNLLPDFQEDEGITYNFWLTLAVFFPAVTGIMAGANISGDLRNPSKDIPKGTLTAVIVSTFVYSLLAFIVGAVVRRNELIANKLVMEDISLHFSIVLIGIYAATLSSGIASLVGAPRIIMAVGQDKILPFKWITYFSVSNKNGEPIRGYFLSFFIAAACNCIGTLNAIAPIIAMFFMLAYFMINLSCFMLSISKSPGWRPSFKYYNKWTALFGSIICVIIMFLLEWRYALACCFLGGFIFIYILYTDPVVDWGSALQSRLYYHVYKSLYRLKRTYTGHVKNWRPGFLVLIEDPKHKPQLMLFSQTLKKSYGPLFFGTIHTGDYRTNIEQYRQHMSDTLGYLPNQLPGNSKGFYETVLANNLRNGIQNLLQLSGMGSLRPNTLIIGFKNKYNTDTDTVVNEYVNILRDSLLMGYGIMICCGLERINWIVKTYAPPPPSMNSNINELYPVDDKIMDYNVIHGKNKLKSTSHSNNYNNDDCDDSNNIEHKIDNDHYNIDIDNNSNLQNNDSWKWALGQKKTTIIDVWFMIDDGGLPLLLGNIMKKHTFWHKCQLRLSLICDENEIGIDVIKIEKMVKLFRLKFKKPRTIIVKNGDNPSEKIINKFEKLSNIKINELPRPQVIKRWLKTCEIMYKHSRYSGLNIVTLPIPHKRIPSKSYMTLLKLMSDQDILPPTIIVRGNGQSVLTFYSE